jgi:hypothetical protein
LTEDLDLSFRAQIAGYKIEYLEKFESPAELPVEMNGLKGQQFRWNKGGAQNAIKLLKLIWSTDKLNLTQKLHGTSQLLAYGVFLWVFVAGLSSIPLAFAFSELGISAHYLAVSVLGLFSIIGIYYTANIQAALHRNGAPATLLEKVKFFALFFSFMPISMGLSLYNAIAVIEGYSGKASSFVRTPKFGITGPQASKEGSLQRASYVASKISWVTFGELFLAILFASMVVIGYRTDNTAFMLLHSMMSAGFGFIAYYSIKHLSYK